MTERAAATEEEAGSDAALARAREAIDAVDAEIHDLLIRRAELVRGVARAKARATGEPAPSAPYRPAREAAILRARLAQNREPLPFAAVAALWRELIGAFTAMQAPLTVSVQALKDKTESRALRALARDHFGAAARIVEREGFGRVAADVIARPGTVGLVSAAFGDEREDHWWTACLGAECAGPKVVGALPFFGGPIRAYCLAAGPLDPSGDDRTLIAVALGDAWSRSAIGAALDGAPCAATLVAVQGANILLCCEGFHAGAGSQGLAGLAAAFEVRPERLSIVGAYAAPIRLPTDGASE